MITMVTNDLGDWQGIYVNGKLVREGHRLNAEDVLGVLGIEFEYLYGINLEKWSSCPTDLTELLEQENESPKKDLKIQSCGRDICPPDNDCMVCP